MFKMLFKTPEKGLPPASTDDKDKPPVTPKSVNISKLFALKDKLLGTENNPQEEKGEAIIPLAKTNISIISPKNIINKSSITSPVTSHVSDTLITLDGIKFSTIENLVAHPIATKIKTAEATTGKLAEKMISEIQTKNPEFYEFYKKNKRQFTKNDNVNKNDDSHKQPIISPVKEEKSNPIDQLMESE